jgi:hypothetical protein
MASGAYQSWKKSMLDGTNGGLIDFDTNTIKGLLAGNLNTHDNRDDVTEVTGTNYSAGGATLTGITVTASSGTITLDANDLTFSNVTIAAIRGLVTYKSTGVASADPLALWHDLGAQSVTAANFVVQFNASGLATLT